MTKEPIMINDVDVRECEYIKKGFCNCVGHLLGEYDRKPSAQGIYCENNPNCYFKQLKRKEQECEELRDELEWVHGYKDTLKKEKKDLQMQFCSICGESFLTPKGAELYDENEKLKQALQEIKGITIIAKTKQFVDMEDFWEQILQKIKEVENGRN